MSHKISRKSTKTRLKTMRQGSRLHIFRNAKRIIKYGLIGFGRNIWLSLTATLVMVLTLTLLFMTIAASTVLSTTADAMREKIDITIFFEPKTPEKTLNSMADTMRRDSNIKTVSISTSESEYQKFLDENAEDHDLLATLSDEAMREVMLASMPATMRIKVYDASDLSSVKTIVDKDKEFSKNVSKEKGPTYDTNDTAIDTIASWSNIAKNGGLILCGIFLVVSILVIFNTIRMAIYSRSEEIYMEKLVGADNSFVRGPFLIEAMLCGIIAGIISTGIGIGIIHLVAPKLESYDIDMSKVMNIINSPQVLAIFGILILVGATIALISSRLAVRKYLRKI